MDKKRSAWFFIFLVCSSQVWTGLDASVPSHKPEKGCEIDAQFKLIVTETMERVKLRVKKEYHVEDQSTDKCDLKDIRIHDLHKARVEVTDCKCECYEDFIRIFIEISIFDILLTFLLSLKGILGGLLSSLIDTLVKILQGLVDPLLIKLLRIDFVIVLEQHTYGKCEVIDVFVDKVGTFKVLNIDLTKPLENLLGGLLGDVLVIVADLLFTTELEDLIKEEFEKLKIEKHYHNCNSPDPKPTQPPKPTKPPKTCHKCMD